MCEALRELFADDLRESREEGIMEGRNVGKLEGKLEGAASKVIEIVIKKYKKEKNIRVSFTQDEIEKCFNGIPKHSLKEYIISIAKNIHDV